MRAMRLRTRSSGAAILLACSHSRPGNARAVELFGKAIWRTATTRLCALAPTDRGEPATGRSVYVAGLGKTRSTSSRAITASGELTHQARCATASAASTGSEAYSARWSAPTAGTSTPSGVVDQRSRSSARLATDSCVHIAEEDGMGRRHGARAPPVVESHDGLHVLRRMRSGGRRLRAKLRGWAHLRAGGRGFRRSAGTQGIAVDAKGATSTWVATRTPSCASMHAIRCVVGLTLLDVERNAKRASRPCRHRLDRGDARRQQRLRERHHRFVHRPLCARSGDWPARIRRALPGRVGRNRRARPLGGLSIAATAARASSRGCRRGGCGIRTRSRERRSRLRDGAPLSGSASSAAGRRSSRSANLYVGTASKPCHDLWDPALHFLRTKRRDRMAQRAAGPRAWRLRRLASISTRPDADTRDESSPIDPRAGTHGIEASVVDNAGGVDGIDGAWRRG